jgi:hypothetical protein
MLVDIFIKVAAGGTCVLAELGLKVRCLSYGEINRKLELLGM